MGRERRRRGDDGAIRGADRQRPDYRPTQLSWTDALRAREVATPTPADLAAAEDDVILVRRHYTPPAS